ncbi:hypothetical protein MPSEU_000015000 [Mayamaea pseudoterrestris]|nr:hypothetical protein MPSEU_000015000 [Mayamaea pseudoterrestris]
MGATRQFILHKLLLLVLGNILSPCHAKVKSRQLAISEATSFKCQMTMSNTFYASGKYGQEVACIYQNDYIWPIDNFPSDLQQYYQADLLQGTLWIKIINARSKDARIVTTENTRYKILSSSPLQSSTNARASGTASTGVSPTLLNPASGKQTIFILRVSTTDSEPTYSLPALKRQIVGRTTTDTSPSIREQYSKCSFNQLNFVYADGQTVEINASVTAFATPAALVDAALQRLAALRRVSSVSTLATRMMIVLPPGTLGTPWLSNAGVNYWRSTYNDKWAMSLSAGMHEIGHNLGLLHSGEGTLDPDLSYGDKTGYMVRVMRLLSLVAPCAFLQASAKLLLRVAL